MFTIYVVVAVVLFFWYLKDGFWDIRSPWHELCMASTLAITWPIWVILGGLIGALLWVLLRFTEN